MSALSRRASGTLSPATIYGFAGGVGGIVIIIVLLLLLRRHRKQAKRARQRFNNTRSRNLANPTPPQSSTPDNSSQRSHRSRLPHSTSPHTGYLRYDRPLPPLPLEATTFLNRTPHSIPSATSVPSNPHDIALARLAALHPSLSARPPSSQQQQPNTSSDADMILLDEGTTSNTSAYDIERRPPPVNEAYALDRRERDRIYAQMGYSESEAMLASDLGVPSDVGAPEKRVPPPLMSGRELWRVEEGEWEREQERTVRKVAPRAQLRSPAPKRWVGLSGQDVTERSASRGRSQSAGRNTHLTPARALDRDSSDRRGRSRSNTADTARTLMPHNGFLQADQPQTEPRGVSTHDDLPHEESLDSSNFSQVDLGASSASADTYVSTEISDDPWREEVLENRRRGR